MGRPLILGDLVHNGVLNERENNTHTHTRSLGGVCREEGRTPPPPTSPSRGAPREFWLPSQSMAHHVAHPAGVVRRSSRMPTAAHAREVRVRAVEGDAGEVASGIHTPLMDQTGKRGGRLVGDLSPKICQSAVKGVEGCDRSAVRDVIRPARFNPARPLRQGWSINHEANFSLL